MTKKQAKKLIWQYGDEILRSKGMALEKRFLQHGKVTVFEHSVAVAVLCLQIADRFSVKVDSASFIKGALLHDYFLMTGIFRIKVIVCMALLMPSVLAETQSGIFRSMKSSAI